MDVTDLDIQKAPGGSTLSVKAVPGASRSRIVGPLGEALKVAVAAVPEKGKANKAIIQTLAKALNVPKGDIELTAGTTQPRKTFLIHNLSPDQLRERLTAM